MNLRRPCSSATLLALFLAGMMPLSIRADYLKNTDLAEGFACWHGDGDPAFLNPDGTEGAEGDKGVVAVIKIPLSPDEPRAVYQEYDTGTDPKSEDIKVQVFASSDFKRSTVPGDYTPNAECKPGDAFGQAAVVVPNVDFWLRARAFSTKRRPSSPADGPRSTAIATRRCRVLTAPSGSVCRRGRGQFTSRLRRSRRKRILAMERQSVCLFLLTLTPEALIYVFRSAPAVGALIGFPPFFSPSWAAGRR